MSVEADFHLRIHEQTFPLLDKWKPSRTASETIIHSAKVAVWCAISFRIIGPYFFEDDNEIAISITWPRYVHIIQTFFTQELTQFPQVNDNTWFQQDGATSHMTRNSFNAINQLFLNHVISRNWGHFLASEVAWFVRLWLFFVGLLKEQSLCSSPTKYCRTETENSRRNHRSPSAYVTPCDGKYTPKVRRVFAQGWRSPWRRRVQKVISFVVYFKIIFL
jgi:hypothetical protein